MGYQTHNIFGILFFLILFRATNLFPGFNLELISVDNFLIYPAVIFGSLLPDIDHMNSKISHNLKLLSKILKKLGLKHRKLTHSILGVIVFNYPFYFLYTKGLLPKLVFTGIVVGYISHLLADMLNPTGVPLFFPVKKKFSIFTIPTSSKAEMVFKTGVIIAIIYIVFIEINII